MKHRLLVYPQRSEGITQRVEEIVGLKRLLQFQTTPDNQSEAGGKPDCAKCYTELSESDTVKARNARNVDMQKQTAQSMINTSGPGNTQQETST